MTTPELPIHIDSTMRSCFVSCPEKFRLEFIHGLRPEGLSIDLHAGACFATAVEQTYRGLWSRGLKLPDALERSHAIFLQEWGDFETVKATSKSKDRMWEAVEDYFAVYPPQTDHVQPYFGEDGQPTFEYTFAIPLEPASNPRDVDLSGKNWLDDALHFPEHPNGSPFLYCGRFDLLGNYHNLPCVRDEKTTGRGFYEHWSESWNLRAQFMGYVWACQQSGLDLDTVIVRGVSIQKTMIKHAEAIKRYNSQMIAQWHEQLRRDMWRLRRSWDEGYFDLNLGDQCTQYGTCIFMPVCTAFGEAKRQWMSNYQVKHWNPLVKNPAKEAA